jgi:hypothetical protein
MQVYTNGRDTKIKFMAENSYDCYLLGRLSTKLNNFSVYMSADKIEINPLGMQNELEVEVNSLINSFVDL